MTIQNKREFVTITAFGMQAYIFEQGMERLWRWRINEVGAQARYIPIPDSNQYAGVENMSEELAIRSVFFLLESEAKRRLHTFQFEAETLRLMLDQAEMERAKGLKKYWLRLMQIIK